MARDEIELLIQTIRVVKNQGQSLVYLTPLPKYRQRPGVNLTSALWRKTQVYAINRKRITKNLRQLYFVGVIWSNRSI